MIAAIESLEFDSADSFFAKLQRSDDYWWTNGDCPWIFRGHRDADWSLTPAAMRPNAFSNLRAEVEKLPQADVRPANEKFERTIREALVQANTECEALHQFARLAREAGINIPVGPPSPMSHGRLFNFGDPNAAIAGDAFPEPLTEPYRGDMYSPPLDVAPIAQHHGIPTRLLDFTADPIVAASFAVSDVEPQASTRPIAVWALNKATLNPFRGRQASLQILEIATHLPIEDFIRVQSAGLLRVRDSGMYYINQERWPILDIELREAVVDQNLPVLRKLTLPGEEIPRLRELLHRNRTTVAHLMPTLDNVAKTLAVQWTADQT